MFGLKSCRSLRIKALDKTANPNICTRLVGVSDKALEVLTLKEQC